MPVQLLYKFRFFDMVSRKWHRARYVATIDDISKRYPAFKIIGDPERREVGGDPMLLVAGHLIPEPKEGS